MNSVLTRRCNKSCTFCFAPNDGSADMPLAEILALASAHVASGEKSISLVGGEPTLHPEFPRVVTTLLELGLHVRVFTHGLLGKAALEAVAVAPPERISLVINASATLGPDGEIAPGVHRTLERVGPKACLGVTVDDVGRPYRALIPLYDRYRLLRWFRLGLAQPTLEGDNGGIPDYRNPALTAMLMSLLLELSAHVIGVNYDCGFVKCTFSPRQHEELDKAGVPMRSRCGAMPDVAPGGIAWPCYPLSSRFTIRRDDADTARTLRRRMNRRLVGIRALGLYPECPTCEHFIDRSCSGGCAARVVHELVPLDAARPA